MLFIVENSELRVKFEGIEKFWAFKRKLVIPKIDIVQATWSESMSIPKIELGLRMGGVGLPGILYAGQFMGRDGLNLVYLHRPQRKGGNVLFNNALTIKVRNSRFHSFIFTIDDPDIAERIITWWSTND